MHTASLVTANGVQGRPTPPLQPYHIRRRSRLKSAALSFGGTRIMVGLSDDVTVSLWDRSRSIGIMALATGRRSIAQLCKNSSILLGRFTEVSD